MSNKSLTNYSLDSGEYFSIHLKPWIISTIKEKEVTSLQWWIKPHKIETFGRLTARAHATNDTTHQTPANLMPIGNILPDPLAGITDVKIFPDHQAHHSTPHHSEAQKHDLLDG